MQIDTSYRNAKEFNLHEVFYLSLNSNKNVCAVKSFLIGF
jgi:hypothetical protein